MTYQDHLNGGDVHPKKKPASCVHPKITQDAPFLQNLPLHDMSETPDPLFPLLSLYRETQDTSWGSLPKISSFDCEGYTVDQDILRSCLVHRNAVDQLALRLSYLGEESLEEQFRLWKHTQGQAPYPKEPCGHSSSPLHDEQPQVESPSLASLVSTVDANEIHCLDDLSLDPTQYHSTEESFDLNSSSTPPHHHTTPTRVTETKASHQLNNTCASHVEPSTMNELWKQHLPLNFSSPEKDPVSSGSSSSYRRITCVRPERIGSRRVVEGIEVLGPYAQWLEPQEKLVSSLLKTVKEGGHAMLESPTGTGKTTAILCALLAWQLFIKKVSRSRNQHIPVIFFCTRTHSQITQIIQEVKRIPYVPITCCLASPTRLCPYFTNHEAQDTNVSKANFRMFCRNAVSFAEKSRLKGFHRVSHLMKKQCYSKAVALMTQQRYSTHDVQLSPCQKCPFYLALDNPCYAQKCFQALVPNTDFYTENDQGQPLRVCTVKNDDRVGLVWDLEDLKHVTLRDSFKKEEPREKKHHSKPFCEASGPLGPDPAEPSGATPRGCPYYTAQALAKGADLIVLPYQLILNPTLLSRNRFPLKDAVIVFDEAHNIEQTCCEEGSSRLLKSDLSMFLKTLNFIILRLTDQPVENLISQSSLLTSFYSSHEPLTGENLAGVYSASLRLAESHQWSVKLSTLFSLCCAVLLSFKCLMDSIDTCVKGDGKRSHKVHENSSHLVDRSEPNCPSASPYPYVIKDWGLLDEPHDTSGCEAFFKEMKLDQLHMTRLSSYIVSLYDTLLHERSDVDSSDSSVPAKMSANVFDEFISYFRQPFFVNLTSFLEILMLSFQYKRCYVVSLVVLNEDMDWEIKLSLMILTPLMEMLCQRVRSVILMSGTLSPMVPLLVELGSTFSSRLSQMIQTKHVIDSTQLLALATFNLAPGTRSLESKAMDAHCTAANLRDPTFLLSLGRTILSLVKHIPAGVVVFFPSYACLSRVMDLWQQHRDKSEPMALGNNPKLPAFSLWEEFFHCKEFVLVEPKDPKDFGHFLTSFRQHVDTSGSCLALAVYRGKLSEGLSMGNDYIRAAICVGIPYPNLKSPMIIQKRRFNDQLVRQRLPLSCLCERSSPDVQPSSSPRNSFSSLSLLTGNQWYQLQAFQALNQAMGRVIRHQNDYGVIVLLDSRHRKPSNTFFLHKTDASLPEEAWKQNFSKWLHPFLFSCSFKDTIAKIQHFFSSRQTLTQKEFSCPSTQQKVAYGTSATSLSNTTQHPLSVPVTTASESHTFHPSSSQPSIHSLSRKKPYRVSSLSSLTTSSSSLVQPFLPFPQEFKSRPQHTP